MSKTLPTILGEKDSKHRFNKKSNYFIIGMTKYFYTALTKLRN